MSSSSRKRLVRQLDASLAEAERLRGRYQRAVERLELSLRGDLPPAGCAQWFSLYLRVADLGVQIRRGEIRHRSSRSAQFACMHTTGIKGAKHSGLSIDDANAIYKMLDDRNALTTRRLDQYFMRMEALDSDDIQRLDERLTESLERFRALKSAFYAKLEVSGSDPHEALSVYGGAAQRGQVIARVVRVCQSPSTCTCVEDAEPWEGFVINADADASIKAEAASAVADCASSIDAGGSADVDVGMLDIRRQFGYDEPQSSNIDHRALAQEARELKRLRVGGSGGAIPDPKPRAMHRPTPGQVYKTKRKESGAQPKPAVLELFSVRNGTMRFDLSSVGFQSADDLHDIAQVVSEVGSYVSVDELDVSNSFFNRNAFDAFCKLVKLPGVSKSIKKVTLRGLSLPRRDDFAALLRLLQTSGDIRELDISFNTLFLTSAQCMELLFRAHPRLERLAMVSCFPDPDRMSQAELADVIATVRAAFLSCSSGTSLQLVRLDANWLHHSWLSALLSADSCLQELRLSRVAFVSLPEDENVDTTGNQHAASDLHFDHLTSLTVSSEATERHRLAEGLINGLRRGFQVDFMQLKHLELAVDFSTANQVAPSIYKGVMELAEQVRDYGALTSLSLLLEGSEANDTKLETLKQLVASGLGECEALKLAAGRVRSLRSLQELVADCALPKARTAELSVEIAVNDGSVFKPTSEDEAKEIARSMCASIGVPGQWSSLSALTLLIELLVATEDQPIVDHAGHPIDVLFEEIGRAWTASDGSSTSRGFSASKRRGTESALGHSDNAHCSYERVTYSCYLTTK